MWQRGQGKGETYYAKCIDFIAKPGIHFAKMQRKLCDQRMGDDFELHAIHQLISKCYCLSSR